VSRRRFRRAAWSFALAAAAVLVSGCDGGGADTANFNAFVKSQLATTSETREPVALDGIVFTAKPGDDDPTAFDDVLGVASGG
jgi:hypothetical protein